MNKRVIPIRLSSVFILCIFSFFVFLPASAFSACPDTMTSYWKLDGELNPPYLNEIDPNFDGECKAVGACPTPATDWAVGEGAQEFERFNATTGTGINIPASGASDAPFDWEATDSFTIEVWIKRPFGDGFPDTEVVVGREFATGTVNWWIGLNTAGAAVFRLKDSANGGPGNLVGAKTGLNDGEWHHIVAVRDAVLGQNRLYVDGSLEDGNESAENIIYGSDFKSATAPMNIGWLNADPFFHFNGVIDEVAIYNVALSETTIKKHYILSKPYCEVSAVGVFRRGAWYLDSNGNNRWDNNIDTIGSFGLANDIPVRGDWNGSGYSNIGVFRSGAWYLDANGNHRWDSLDTTIKSFGLPNDIPVTGDWNGDGKTNVGVFRNGAWYLDYNGNGMWDPSLDTTIKSFGLPNDIPVTGDWNGDGKTNVGVFRNGVWYLDANDNYRWDPSLDTTIKSFGLPNDIPVTGDWNGDGKTNVGVFRKGSWYLDYNGNGKWDPGVDITILAPTFGYSTDIPVTGVWR